MTSPALDALLALQALDTSRDQLEHRQKTLPERRELSLLSARRAALSAARAAIAETRDEIASREQQLEDQLQGVEERAREVDRRLYGGTVTASRELQAMAGDVTALRARASELEDRALEVLEEREPLDADLAERDAEIAVIDESAAGLTVSLRAAEEAVSAELDELEARRKAVTASVPSDLIPLYERLRARLGGVAVARLAGGRCDGCHLTLPATEIDQLRHLPADAVVTCEQCGRILVRP